MSDPTYALYSDALQFWRARRQDLWDRIAKKLEEIDKSESAVMAEYEQLGREEPQPCPATFNGFYCRFVKDHESPHESGFSMGEGQFTPVTW